MEGGIISSDTQGVVWVSRYTLGETQMIVVEEDVNLSVKNMRVYCMADLYRRQEELALRLGVHEIQLYRRNKHVARL